MSREVNELLRGWGRHRARTQELLAALSPDDLAFTPGDGLGPWWKQFRHAGRVQEDYLAGLDTGVMRFDPRRASYAGGPARQALADYLAALDRRLETFALGRWTKGVVRWDGGEQVAVPEHLRRLMEHEVLHHGQWIVLARLRAVALPAAWSEWGF